MVFLLCFIGAAGILTAVAVGLALAAIWDMLPEWQRKLRAKRNNKKLDQIHGRHK